MKMKQLTFPDSGKVLYTKPFSIKVISLKLQRKYPRPEPPLQVIENPDGSIIREYNYTHPEYKSKIYAWEEFINNQSGIEALNKSRKFRLTDEQKEEIEQWKQENPNEWDESELNRDLWLENIAIQTDNDFDAFMNFLGVSEPNQEDVEAIQNGFPG